MQYLQLHVTYPQFLILCLYDEGRSVTSRGLLVSHAKLYLHSITYDGSQWIDATITIATMQQLNCNNNGQPLAGDIRFATDRLRDTYIRDSLYRKAGQNGFVFSALQHEVELIENVLVVSVKGLLREHQHLSSSQVWQSLFVFIML